MITVNGLQIDDLTNYIVEEITFRSIPSRDLKLVGVSRKPRTKFTASEWKSKEIAIKGRVFGSSASDLRDKLDTLQLNFAVQSLPLSIDPDRTYTATLDTLDIPTQFYNSTMVEYDAKFVCFDPFSYGQQLLASGVVPAGVVTYSGTVTISGSVFAEPVLTINPTGALAGLSGLRAFRFLHVPTGETITISGTLNYTSPIIIDFHNFLVTNSGVASDYLGIFSRFDPGVVNYQITTISGTNTGFDFKWSYQPRFYQ